MPIRAPHEARPCRGFSLIEFMIAITVSLLILAAMSTAFVSSSRARTELERSSQQIENGRYALSALSDDLQLAGYLSQFNIVAAGLTPPAAKPAPCAITPAALIAAMPLHIQGYDNQAVTCLDADGDDLLSDYKAGTDVLVVRHVSTCVRGATNCPDQDGAPYFQASLCETELSSLTPLGADTYRLDTDIDNLDRKRRNCTTTAEIRQFLVHVYFVTNNDEAGDGIPTLKRAELGGEDGDAFYTAFSVAHGIENLQFEYGIDTDGAGVAGYGHPNVFTADPDIYDGPGGAAGPFANCAANADCTQNWANVMSVKVTLLARNPDETRDYTNTKIYELGLNAAGGLECAKAASNDGAAGETCAAFNDRFKRHAYQSAIRLVNAAARRE